VRTDCRTRGAGCGALLSATVRGATSALMRVPRQSAPTAAVAFQTGAKSDRRLFDCAPRSSVIPKRALPRTNPVYPCDRPASSLRREQSGTVADAGARSGGVEQRRSRGGSALVGDLERPHRPLGSRRQRGTNASARGAHEFRHALRSGRDTDGDRREAVARHRRAGRERVIPFRSGPRAARGLTNNPTNRWRNRFGYPRAARRGGRSFPGPNKSVQSPVCRSGAAGPAVATQP
jgi:hypothetical protein